MKQISFIEDIFKEIKASEEEQIAIKSWFDYVAKETANTDVYAIEIPKIGTLHRNHSLTTNSKQRLSVDSKEHTTIENMMLEMRYFKEQKNSKTPHLKIPLTYGMVKEIGKTYELNNNVFTSDKQIKEIYAAVEKEQNKAYERGF